MQRATQRARGAVRRLQRDGGEPARSANCHGVRHRLAFRLRQRCLEQVDAARELADIDVELIQLLGDQVGIAMGTAELVDAV